MSSPGPDARVVCRAARRPVSPARVVWRARRSTLPFGVVGRASRATMADGTMYAGSFCFRKARRSPDRTTSPASGTTKATRRASPGPCSWTTTALSCTEMCCARTASISPGSIR